MQKGFTLIELVISIGLIAILATVSAVNFFNYKNAQSVDLTGKEIVSMLRNAQNNSFSQESGTRWGVYFQNTASSSYFALFKGSVYSSASTTQQNPLPSNVQFLLPASGASSTVVFAPITGVPNASITIRVSLINNINVSSTIIVNANGQISY